MSSVRTKNYRKIPSRNAELADTFRRQMADFARGQHLVKLRQARHLSQEDAAYEIGVTSKSLRAWEHGGKIRWDNAKKLAEFYGVEAEGLVSREIVDPGDIHVPPMDVPEWAQELLDGQRQIRQMLTVLIGHFELQEAHRQLDAAERSSQPPAAAASKSREAA
jgi:transcriptional regulator with XRE-family HTH domain